jgi:hypothetical protein
MVIMCAKFHPCTLSGFLVKLVETENDNNKKMMKNSENKVSQQCNISATQVF